MNARTVGKEGQWKEVIERYIYRDRIMRKINFKVYATKTIKIKPSNDVDIRLTIAKAGDILAMQTASGI